MYISVHAVANLMSKGSVRSHFLETSLWERLWTYFKTDYMMIVVVVVVVMMMMMITYTYSDTNIQSDQSQTT
jgi:hypothetical protein